jgi:hypothetical protein
MNSIVKQSGTRVWIEHWSDRHMCYIIDHSAGFFPDRVSAVKFLDLLTIFNEGE